MSDEKLRKLQEEFKQFRANGKAAANAADDLNASIGQFIATGAKATDRLNDVSTAYADMQKAMKGAASMSASLTLGISGLLTKIPLIGTIAGSAAAAVGGIGTAFMHLAEVAAGAPKVFIEGMDKWTAPLRRTEGQMFDLHKRFGGTIEEAKKFTDTMRLASDNPLAKSLFMSTNEMIKFVAATERTQLTQTQLNQTVQTGAGAIELFGAAAAFARSSNIEMSTAAELLNTLMNKQGKSAQEATNMFGLYIGVAEETGLSIDKVAGSLNGAVANFAKIGMAADFGKPIMEGFAKTMNDMNLGIEESIGLSSGLTQSLAGLTNNYGMAYLTFQRGGLDIGGGGGGGVLGSSIALQAAYMDADKTGDQAVIGDQLVRGMRDTLASFTGGDIVTVQQANEDSSLQNQFYTQQQMLKSSFGIQDDNSAARVLDMLSRLDDATRSGDVEAQKHLKEQIAKEKKGTDLTLDEMQKVNKKLEIQINLMAADLAVRAKLDNTRRAAAFAGNALDPALGLAAKGARAGITTAGGIIGRGADYAEKMLGLDPKSNAARLIRDGFKDVTGIGPMNQIDGEDFGIAADAVRTAGVGKEGGEQEKLRMLLLNASGQDIGGGKKRFGKGATVATEIDRIAGIIAKQSDPSLRGDKDQAAYKAALVEEFKTALGQINVKIDLGDEAAKVFGSAKEVTKSIRNMNYEKEGVK
jgi:hypothetical protein